MSETTDDLAAPIKMVRRIWPILVFVVAQTIAGTVYLTRIDERSTRNAAALQRLLELQKRVDKNEHTLAQDRVNIQRFWSTDWIQAQQEVRDSEARIMALLSDLREDIRDVRRAVGASSRRPAAKGRVR